MGRSLIMAREARAEAKATSLTHGTLLYSLIGNAATKCVMIDPKRDDLIMSSL